MSDPSPTRRPRRSAALAASAAVVLVLAACGSAATSQAPTSQAPGGENSVTMSGVAFTVAEITAPVGSLTFVNEDGVRHVLAEGENGTQVASPRVQKVTINGGSQGDLVFATAGDYHITCTLHPTMNMVVHVQ